MSDKTPTSVELLDRCRRALADKAGLQEPVSYYQVAKVLGVSRASISAIRNGKTTLGSPTAPSVAEILGVPAAWVLNVIQAERAQNDRLRQIWTEAARKLAVVFFAGILLSVALPSPNASGATNDLCILCKYKHMPGFEAAKTGLPITLLQSLR